MEVLIKIEFQTNTHSVAKLQLIWETIKNIKTFNNKVFRENSQELAEKQAEFIVKL